MRHPALLPAAVGAGICPVNAPDDSSSLRPCGTGPSAWMRSLRTSSTGPFPLWATLKTTKLPGRVSFGVRLRLRDGLLGRDSCRRTTGSISAGPGAFSGRITPTAPSLSRMRWAASSPSTGPTISSIAASRVPSRSTWRSRIGGLWEQICRRCRPVIGAGSVVPTAATWGQFDLGITQAYIRQNLFANHFQYTVGKIFAPNFIDAYPFFDDNRQFLSQQFSTSPTIASPLRGFGAVGAWFPTKRGLYIKSGMFTSQQQRHGQHHRRLLHQGPALLLLGSRRERSGTKRRSSPGSRAHGRKQHRTSRDGYRNAMNGEYSRLHRSKFLRGQRSTSMRWSAAMSCASFALDGRRVI